MSGGDDRGTLLITVRSRITTGEIWRSRNSATAMRTAEHRATRGLPESARVFILSACRTRFASLGVTIDGERISSSPFREAFGFTFTNFQALRALPAYHALSIDDRRRTHHLRRSGTSRRKRHPAGHAVVPSRCGFPACTATSAAATRSAGLAEHHAAMDDVRRYAFNCYHCCQVCRWPQPDDQYPACHDAGGVAQAQRGERERCAEERSSQPLRRSPEPARPASTARPSTFATASPSPNNARIAYVIRLQAVRLLQAGSTHEAVAASCRRTWLQQPSSR